MKDLSESTLEVTCEQVERLLAESNFHIIDVREPFELAVGKLPCALELPMSRFLETAESLDKDHPMIIYCAHGVRSLNVAHWLRENGYRAWSMAGGFSEWNGPIDQPQ